MSGTIEQRRTSVAVILALLFTPFASMLYLNRGKFALMYGAADLAIDIVVLSFLPLRHSHSPDATIWLAQLPVLLVGLVHGVLISRNWNSAEIRRWYSHWYAIGGILLAFPMTALIIRTFIFQPFDIPSTSMSPTLNQGDYFWVSKFAYRWGGPKRGDVIVFRAPQLGSWAYVKRVVGLPGDRVQMRHGMLYINGRPARQSPIADFIENCDERHPCRVSQYLEALPGGHKEAILNRINGGADDDTGLFVVPQDSYFVLGDNRDNSADTRNEMGFIKRADIIGRASRKFVENGHWSWKRID